MARLAAFAESVDSAVRALRANPLRGTLTTLGIVIGVVGVTTTMTAANGLATSFRQNASVIGADVLYVSRQPWMMRGNGRQFHNRPPVSLRETRALERALHGARAVNPTAQTSRRIRFGSETLAGIDIIGTTDRHLLVSSAVPAVGRFLSPLDIRFKERVCVIGSEVRTQLFGPVDPLGRVLQVGAHAFRVVGVMEKQGSMNFFGGPNFDLQVFMPITTFAKLYGAAERDLNIAVQASGPEALVDLEHEVVGELRKIRRLHPTEEANFAINRLDSLTEMFDRVMAIVLLVGTFVTGIALVVGGIGVANILFVSVTERTREIGIRKALGAPRRDILAQFLAEALIICLAGGTVGLVISWVVARGLDAFLLPAQLSPGIVFVALTLSALVGLTSGMIPAWRASRLPPVEALRFE